MRKYENVDVVAALGAVLEVNTEHYKSDFKYDLDMFKEAAAAPDGENNRLVWLSRQNGTECFKERDIYLVESQAHNSWTYYADSRSETPRAYAVDIKGYDGGTIKGDIYELDYHAHARQVKKEALHVITVSAKYADGTDLHLPYKEWDGHRERLYHQHGELMSLRREPEDENALRGILAAARAERQKQSRPAVFKVSTRAPARKPTIKEQIATGKKEIEQQRAAAPQRAAARNKNTGLEV
jgi:hypothetical protein